MFIELRCFPVIGSHPAVCRIHSIVNVCSFNTAGLLREAALPSRISHRQDEMERAPPLFSIAFHPDATAVFFHQRSRQ